MTSASQGYDTQYYHIGDIHEDLNVGGAGNDQEFEFLSGYSSDLMNPKSMRLWKNWMDYVLFNQITPRPYDAEKVLSKALAIQNTNLPSNSTTNNQPLSVYDTICLDPNLSKFKDLINEAGYGLPYSDNITIFAPINNQFDFILGYALKIAYRSVAVLQTLRYHILPYRIKPWQLKDRYLRLRTSLEYNPVESDWTNGKSLLINKINTEYISPPAGSFTNSKFPDADPYPARPDTWFPKITDEVQILKAIECRNGWLYIIERPIVWSDLM